MKNQEYIENYFLGRLSASEMKHFEDLLKSDVAFKKEFDFQESLQKVIDLEEDEAFKNTLQNYENKKQTKKHYKIWSIAASVLVLFGLSYFVLFQENVSNEELFAQNFEPYRNVIQPIERGDVLKDLKTQAFAAYEKGNYKNAISLFSELQKTQTNLYYIFYKANSYLALENTSEAIALLQKYITLNGKFTEKAQWYLALAYLKVDNVSEAKKILQNIEEEKSYNYEKASQILQNIK